MSIRTEDRLAAALRARAEQVQPEDLAPLRVPEPAHRPRTPWLLGLAAAACAAVVVAAFAHQQHAAPPAPSHHVGDGHAVVQQRADVDGDGVPDRVGVRRDASDNGLLVVVDLFQGGRVQAHIAGTRSAPEVPRPHLALLPPADLNGDGAQEIGVADGGAATMPAYFTLFDGRLTSVTLTDRPGSGWTPNSPRDRFGVSHHRLYSWQLPESASTTVHEITAWVWRMSPSLTARPHRVTRCLRSGWTVPRSCAGSALPRVDRVPSSDVDGRPDQMSLRYTVRGGETDGFTVVAQLASGRTVRATGPGGWVPSPVAEPALAGDARHQIVVSQEGGDADLASVFGWYDGRLTRLTAPAGTWHWCRGARHPQRATCP